MGWEAREEQWTILCDGLTIGRERSSSRNPSCSLTVFCILNHSYYILINHQQSTPPQPPQPIHPSYLICIHSAFLPSVLPKTPNNYIINRNKRMALRKTQLKKMTIDEISLHLSSETDPENIRTIANYIGERNAGLQQKRSALMEELKAVRGKLVKSVRDLNGRVKDRIDKKQTIILDKDSRPSASTITELMGLFSYLENQGSIITRNNQAIKELAQSTQQTQVQLQRKAERRLEYDALDQQYERLNAECKKEEAIRDALLKERDQKRSHYANIESSIEAYRKQYEKVQSAIRIKERELIQLSGYYEARTNEDKGILQELPAQSLEYERELLAAQAELNACRALLDERKIMQIQGGLS